MRTIFIISNPYDIRWTTCYAFMVVMTFHNRPNQADEQILHANYDPFELFTKIKQNVPLGRRVTVHTWH